MYYILYRIIELSMYIGLVILFGFTRERDVLEENKSDEESRRGPRAKSEITQERKPLEEFLTLGHPWEWANSGI